MSCRVSKEKADAIAIEYMTNGQNKVKALLAVGYKPSYANKNGLKLWDNVLVKQAIAKISLANQIKTGITFEWIQNKHKEALDRLISKDETNYKGHLESLGRTIAAYKDTSINIDKETAPVPDDEVQAVQASEEKRKALRIG